MLNYFEIKQYELICVILNKAAQIIFSKKQNQSFCDNRFACLAKYVSSANKN